MSRRGENIYKRKDGRWEGRYVKGHDDFGKTQFGYVYAKTYREIREKLANAKLMNEKEGAEKERKFEFYCVEWLDLSRNRVKKSTYVKYFNMVNRYLKTDLGELYPHELSSIVIEKYSNKLLDNGLSTKTVRDILVVIKAILKHCRRQLGSALPEIEIIYPKEKRKEMRVLSVEEQERLVKYLVSNMDEVKFGILLALLTGMRIGEICALKWKDISLDEKIIKITSTMQRLQVLNDKKETKTEVVIGDAKSQKSNRIIPITDATVSICKKMLVDDKEAFVLTGEPNQFLEPRALQYKFKKITEECNLEGVHFHSLRHTFATRCVEVGFEIKSLSEILGHSSSKVTLDRYVHSSLELKRENMQKLSSIGM